VKVVLIAALVLAVLFVAGLVAAFALVASPPPAIAAPRDVFDFTSIHHAAGDVTPPSVRRYQARDGEELAFRFYPSTAARILIFIHGSSYHGGGYHALAAALSLGGAAQVVLPNLRGHYLSGRHRGDVEYIGQLEDDIVDLVRFLRAEHHDGPITLGGHSSGGGLAIRFAGGGHADTGIASYLLLSPIIPRAPSVRGGTAGGWANLYWRRLFGLLALNAIGIHGFDGLPIVDFNKPPKFWDGTETLTYSYRLNVSYHPRHDYRNDIKALGDNTLVLVGANDEAVDGEALRALIAADAPGAKTMIPSGVSHLGLYSDPAALDAIATWLHSLPSGSGG
jgi:alpha-beta hydrolase superfamily lysophospholipase